MNISNIYNVLRKYIENNKITAVCILITAAVVILCILSKISESDSADISGNVIKRPDYVDNSEKYSLDVYKKGQEDPYTVDFELSARKYTQEQVFENFDSAYNLLTQRMLGDNESLEVVRNDLSLITQIDEYAITVEWYSNNYKVVNYDGKVCNDEQVNSPVEVILTAKLTYADYSSTYPITIVVHPKILDESDLFVRKVREAIETSSDEYSESIYLPEEIDGEKIYFKKKTESSVAMIIVLGITGAITIICAIKLQKKKEKEDRDKQLKYDYSEVVSKLTLLVGSGMTIRKAWEKIAIDYKYKIEKKGGEIHYAYEEMLTAYYQMQSGISEGNAYAQFGNRCGIKEYLKLGALLEQNLRKGTKGLTEMLEKEVTEAFEDRKSLAKIQGEEAGTKLLLPMGIMLMIVMVIVIVPALMSFNV